MSKSLITLPEIKIVGISVRTNNKNEFNPEKSQIGKTIQKFYQENFSEKISHRKNPGVTFSIYTEYDSDEHGDYTYIFGEEVNTFVDVPTEMRTLTIPASQYQKITTPVGKMPDIVIQTWQAIWNMSSQELGGDRSYIADFERYDERAADPLNACVDVYVGLR